MCYLVPWTPRVTSVTLEDRARVLLFGDGFTGRFVAHLLSMFGAEDSRQTTWGQKGASGSFSRNRDLSEMSNLH